MAQQHRLWYEQPAAHWLEALPIGNSTLGAMVYGGTLHERIDLNETTFWSGSPYNNDAPRAKDSLQCVRELIRHGKEEQAEGVINRNFFTGKNGMRFLPLGSLLIDMPTGEQGNKRQLKASAKLSGDYSYHRSLSLEQAVNTTTFVQDGVKIKRTVFTSFAGRFMAVHLQASRKGALHFSVSLSSILNHKVEAQRQQLSMVCQGEEQEGVDVSSWGGLVIEYESTIDFSVELVTDGNKKDSYYGTYAASAPKSRNHVRQLVLPWSKFKRSTGWGFSVNKTSALKHIAAVKFKFEGRAGTVGDFRITKIRSIHGSAAAFYKPASSDLMAVKPVSLPTDSKAILAGRTLSLQGITDGKVQVLNLRGQVVKSATAGSSMDLSNLNAGVYMVRVVGKSVKFAQKISLE